MRRNGSCSMTRMHFTAIAETLKDLRPDRGNKFASRTLRARGAAQYDQWIASVHAMANLCARSNGRFNRDRFLRACGMEE